jgi:hypothetical protein
MLSEELLDLPIAIWVQVRRIPFCARAIKVIHNGEDLCGLLRL